MGFLKKIFGDAADEIKKNLEDSRNDIRKNLEDMKRNAMADFSKRTTSSRDDDDDDDDDDAPRIILGKFSNGVLELRDDIEELDDESLEDYKNVKKIIFPRGLKKLDSDVICDQDKLEELDFSLVTELREMPDDFISGTTKIKEFIVPQGVKELGDGFVGECKPGTKIVIPSTVVKMGYLNGESNNDLVVYLFASRLKIEDAEEDIKTLYVLPEYYGYYAKLLKECDSEARLREMPADMMNIYATAFTAELAKTPAEKSTPVPASEPAHEPEPKAVSTPEPAPVVAPEPAPSAFSGLFSPRLEALINSALQDGVLTEQEKAILKKRAEKEGEDWDEVEMIINSRLPRKEQTSPKKAVELSDIKRAHLFLSFKSYEEDDYAYLFLIDDNQLYATDENLNTPEIPSTDYFDNLDDYDCWIENLSDEYQSFKQLSESLVNDFVEARIDEYDGDTSALAIDSKYTVTIFVDKEKVYEETITSR